MDLYRRLGVRVLNTVRDPQGTEDDGDSRPSPLTIETRTIETTDEAGLLVTFGCVAP